MRRPRVPVSSAGAPGGGSGLRPTGTNDLCARSSLDASARFSRGHSPGNRERGKTQARPEVDKTPRLERRGARTLFAKGCSRLARRESDWMRRAALHPLSRERAKEDGRTRHP